MWIFVSLSRQIYVDGGSVDKSVESPLALANDQIHHTFVHVGPAGIFDDESGGLSMTEKVGGNGTFDEVREIQFKRNRSIRCVTCSLHRDGEKSRDMGRKKTRNDPREFHLQSARAMIVHDIDKSDLSAGFGVKDGHDQFHVSTIGGTEHVTLDETPESVRKSLQLQNRILIERLPNPRFLE